MEKIFLIITLINLCISLENFTFYNPNYYYFGLNSCPSGEEICSSLGNICFPASQCPTAMTCTENLIRINSYSCAIDDIFSPLSQCETDYECWDNTCVEKSEDRKTLCPSMFSCPQKYPVRCSDNSCVENLEDCPEYITCPNFLPIRCPNGDCRQSLEDCPSLITCPANLPVQCNDWSCQLIKDNCKVSSEASQCTENGMTRCSDGSCKSSKFLCSTPMTCPKNYVKCWNGICAPKGECPIPKESSSSTCDDFNNNESSLLCSFDFSCRNDIDSCPTGIICPADEPVRCWDNSCKENILQCPPYQKCPFGMIECPDGSCGIGKCGTHITCSVDAPYRCFDNTCRVNPEDCPPIPVCPSDAPILCWDGRCLSNRGECRTPSSCDSSNPVKCPNGLCAKSGINCKTTDDCPAEFTKCPDGTCLKSTKYCTDQSCPLNFPYKCKNGMCVSNYNYCEKDNGCPWNKPEKCYSGECVSDKSECGSEQNCPEGKRRCPDGSCLGVLISCPAVSGCPSDTPIKCADGTCIKDNGKELCPTPVCPITQPYRCENGFCATTKSSCPSEYKNSEENKELVICADATLAHFFDECKPVSECQGFETARCGDGSCRTEKSACPMKDTETFLDTCPKGTVRCESGICSNTEHQCILSNGCYDSAKPYKCPNNGACVASLQECLSLDLNFTLSNGCERDTPVKCLLTGACVKTKDDCDNLENGCPEGYIMCIDGACDTPRNCATKHSSEECSPDSGRGFLCPATSEATCGESFENCYTRENCVINKPFRCIDGGCKRYPYNSLSFQEDTESCKIGIKCPHHKPFLCLDGTCVENELFCKSIDECPKEAPVRCFDRTCAQTEDECEKKHNKCPGFSPILCSNGNCVTDIFDCQEISCPPWLPIKCVTGECQSVPKECTLQEVLYNEEDVMEKKYGSICKENEFQCYDGTCRKNMGECPIFSGCASLLNPFKCPDGSCVSSFEKCEKSLEEVQKSCINGTQLCEDGICREKCSNFNGCPNSKPLMCSTGHCVSSIAECVADSKCISSDSSFRCVDGSCATSLDKCKSILREHGSTNIVIFTYPKLTINAPIVIGEKNLILASLNVPSDTFIANNVSVESRIFIKSVPKSYINSTYSIYDETRYDDIITVYPYADPNKECKLDNEYTILSSVLNITGEENPANGTGTKIKWNNNLILTMLYDFPHKHEGIIERQYLIPEEEESAAPNRRYQYTSMPLNSLKDICLGKLDEKSKIWNCVNISEKAVSLDNFQLKASINSSGIYAVIMNPKQNDKPLNIEPSFFMRHLLAISIIIIILLLIIGVGTYVFIRIYRYRKRYKSTKQKYADTEIEYKNMEMSHSNVEGETLADQEEGVLFTENPTYKKVKTDGDSNVRQLESMYEKFLKNLKALERNNKILKEKNENMKNEINRLKEYKQELLNQ